jgi:hypothetical protein
MIRVATFAALVFVFVLTSAAAGASAQPPARLAGLPLEEALRHLQARGLTVVYSSELVRAEMKVVAEPKSAAPRRILDEILKPHGLEIRSGAKGTLLVVRARGRQPATPAAPAARGGIRGRIVDARTGAPLPGAAVAVQGTAIKATSDADGRFALMNVPAEPLWLSISIVGYGLARPLVNVQPGGVVEITVPLADGAGTVQETVTVEGSAFRSGLTATPLQQSLTSGELQDLRGLMTDDPFRAAQALPGVATGDDFRSEFSLRGSDVRHIGASVDGIATRWLVHAVSGRGDTGSVGLISGDVLDRLTIDAGAAPARRPGRTGGWVGFDLREGSRSSASARLSVSGSNASMVADGPVGRAGRGAWLFSVRQSYLQWLLRRLDYDATTFGFRDVQAKVVFDVTPRHQLQVIAVAGASTLTEQEEDPGPNSIARGRNRANLAALTWRTTAGQAVVTQRLALMGDRFRNHGDFGQELGRGRSSELAYIADVAWPVAASLVARAGTYLQRQTFFESLRQFGFSAGGLPTERRADAKSARGWTTAGDGQLVWTIGGRATIDAGLRLARSSATGEIVASPWVLGSWTPVRDVTVRAGISGIAQPPDLDQLATAPATVRAERSISVDAGVEHQLTRGLRWQFTAYHRRERDVLRLQDAETRLSGSLLIERVPAPIWANTLAGSSHGFEISLQRRAASGLSGWIGYAYGRTRYEDTNRIPVERYWADFDQRHSLNAYGQIRLSAATSFSSRLRVGSNFPVPGYFRRLGDALFLAEERNAVRLPVYARLDVRANRAFTYDRRRLTLFVEVVNLLGRTNYGPADGLIRQVPREAVGFVEKLFPFVPSAGFLFEF